MQAKTEVIKMLRNRVKVNYLSRKASGIIGTSPDPSGCRRDQQVNETYLHRSIIRTIPDGLSAVLKLGSSFDKGYAKGEMDCVLTRSG